MKAIRYFALVPLCSLGVFLWAQQGPRTTGSETVARPKKGAASTPAEAEQPKIPSQFKRDKQLPEGVPTFSTDAVTVSVDVAVLDNKGHFIPKIPRGNFRVLEDNVPQQVTGYSMGEAPMTIALVVEFTNLYQQYYSETWYQTLTASYGFVQTLRPDDYLAVLAYDLRTEILSDFTTDRNETQQAMARLRMAGFSEANMFDALVFTAERMQEIEGRKAIVLVSTGTDTFSALTFDKTRKALQNAGVPIYTVSLMQALRIVLESYGYLGPLARMDFMQADNQMRTFAKETGGMSFFPRFYGEFPSIFQAINQSLRNQYVLTYSPTNQARDGKVRKIKVEVVNPETNEALRVTDEKGKPIKYSIIAKPGYTAPREVE
jgi:VWFA-related protein